VVKRERPYQHDSTASRLLSEVKHVRAWLVLRWGTTLESQVLFSFCHFPLHGMVLPTRTYHRATYVQDCTNVYAVYLPTNQPTCIHTYNAYVRMYIRTVHTCEHAHAPTNIPPAYNGTQNEAILLSLWTTNPFCKWWGGPEQSSCD
jgi:hypothetical protein